MKTRLQEMIFPLSWEKGASQEGLQTRRMRQMAQLSQALTMEVLEERIAEHRRFLREGGAGGQWQILRVEGLVVGIYVKETKSDARQLSLEYSCLAADVDFSGLALPFVNACAAYLPGFLAEQAALPYSLFTDCFLEKANFRNAQLQGLDFSRAQLVEADFRDADLTNVDFENCDLRGADFRGARIAGARFPGANLEGVLAH